MDINEVVERISYFRYKNNLSARDLSLMIGKSPSYINRLETEKFDLSTKTLLTIIEVFKITPNEFFAKNYTSYTDCEELYTLIEKQPDDKRKLYIELLKSK